MNASPTTFPQPAATDTSLAREICLCAGFRGSEFQGVCAALLMVGLTSGGDFTAASIPRDLLRGDIHLSGLATKALLKMGLCEKVGYCPSPDKSAKGRPVCLLRIPANKRSTALTFLSRQGYSLPAPQRELALA